MKRFSPQNGRYGGHFRNIFESPPAKSPGSVRLLRSSSRSAERSEFRQHRLFSASVPQKERNSKMCQKSGPNHTPHSAERTSFSRSNSQKSSVPQKERIFDKTIKTETETPKARNRETLEKLGKNDPTEPHTATRDKSTADSILSSNTFTVEVHSTHRSSTSMILPTR